MNKLVVVAFLIAGFTVVGCSAQQPAPQKPNDGDLRSKLLEYRKPGEICQSDSPQCKAWMEKALLCETNLVNGIAGNACTMAEQYRETVTGIELSTAPGAFKF